MRSAKERERGNGCKRKVGIGETRVMWCERKREKGEVVRQSELGVRERSQG